MSSQLIHLGGYSEQQVLNSKKTVYGTQAALFFVKKYYGSRELLIYRIILALSSFGKYLVASTLYCFFKKQKYRNNMSKWKASFLICLKGKLYDQRPN